MITTKTAEYRNLLEAHRARRREMGILVRLSPADEERMKDLAAAIRHNKHAPETDGSWNGASFEHRNRLGARGALAVAQYLGGAFDDSLHPGRDPGWDVTHAGTRFEVKTLREFLAFVKPEDFRADFAALVNHAEHTSALMLVGWITRTWFLSHCFEVDFGYGPRLCVSAVDMNPMQAALGWSAEPLTAADIFK